jgi:hypothetical protein
MPRTQKDSFSCGLWAAEVLFQMVMEKRELKEIAVDLTDNLKQRRTFLYRLMSTRYLYIDGGFRNPNSREEEKVPMNKRDQKHQDKFDEGKSDVSAITTKTNKTTGGKALDKHCPLCDFKLVPGKKWSRHCGSFHKDVEIEPVRCDINCSRCQGKYYQAPHLVAKSSPLSGQKLPT